MFAFSGIEFANINTLKVCIFFFYSMRFMFHFFKLSRVIEQRSNKDNVWYYEILWNVEIKIVKLLFVVPGVDLIMTSRFRVTSCIIYDLCYYNASFYTCVIICTYGRASSNFHKAVEKADSYNQIVHEVRRNQL